jgi:hypothetical protein
MTTPTPSKNAHALSSPAPRSVPPTGNLNMMSYDSPAVLNMLNDVANSGMGGVGMGISMSGLGMSSLGMSASTMGRVDEAERSRKLREIVDIIGSKPGRVSEEGLLALCKRMEVPYEKHMDEAGTWSLLIGDTAICDVTFNDDEIVSVNLQTGLDFDDAMPELQFGATGSEILVRSLKPLPGQHKINVTLGRFKESLEKLLKLEKLSSTQNGGVSCYNAIAGVYMSLGKLFEHEKQAELAKRAPDERYRTFKAEREVLCKKSGRPRLNGGSCLGLSLEYWMDRRLLFPKDIPAPSEKGKEKMDAEQPTSYPEDQATGSNKVYSSGFNRIYSLTIECESSPSTLYTPIRISNEWVSDDIEKLTDANDANASLETILSATPLPSIDWLEPKPTYLEASTQGDDAMNLDSAAGRLPNIRFVAKFNPPLVVPYTVHAQLHQIVGIDPPQDFRPTTFVGLAMRPGEVDPGMTGTTGESTHEIRSSRKVLAMDTEGKQTNMQHSMSLFVPKLECSRILESLPFSHPKQLVEILPILRQYAHMTSMLSECFYEAPKKPIPTHKLGQQELTPPRTPPKSSDSGAEEQPTPLQLDVTLSYTAYPTITLHIPHPSSTQADKVTELLSNLLSCSPAIPPRKTLAVTLEVQANGEPRVKSQNLLPERPFHAETEGAMEQAGVFEDKKQRLGKALDLFGDLGLWGEWLRREVGRMEKE